jgi:hypothetical protein
MEPKVEALIKALEQTRELLRKHGDRYASGRLLGLETRLARGDVSAVEGAISEATGGMGSLRDRWLSLANGDAITREEESQVNATLDSHIKEVERSARAAASALGVHLIR